MGKSTRKSPQKRYVLQAIEDQRAGNADAEMDATNADWEEEMYTQDQNRVDVARANLIEAQGEAEVAHIPGSHQRLTCVYRHGVRCDEQCSFWEAELEAATHHLNAVWKKRLLA